MGTKLQRAFFAELLISFAAMHNFTMDTHMKGDAAALKPTTGIISMTKNIRCSLKTCTVGTLSLNEFNFLSTLTCSELVQPEYAYPLGSLRKPVSSRAFLILVLLAACVGLLFMSKSRKLDLSMAMKLAFTSFVGQVSLESTTVMTKLRSTYSPWTLLTTFIHTIYTNELQSTIVVPEIRTEVLPIEQLIQLNYSIFSSQAPVLLY